MSEPVHTLVGDLLGAAIVVGAASGIVCAGFGLAKWLTSSPTPNAVKERSAMEKEDATKKKEKDALGIAWRDSPTKIASEVRPDIAHNNEMYVNRLLEMKLCVSYRLRSWDTESSDLVIIKRLLEIINAEIQLCTMTFFADVPQLRNECLDKLMLNKLCLFERLPASANAYTIDVVKDSIDITNSEIQLMHRMLCPPNDITPASTSPRPAIFSSNPPAYPTPEIYPSLHTLPPAYSSEYVIGDSGPRGTPVYGANDIRITTVGSRN